MKKTLLFLLLVLVLENKIFSQNIIIDSITGKYSSTGIIQVDSLKKEVIYSKVIEWISINYKSSKDVIQLSDKENGKIILKGNFKIFFWLKDGWIAHTLILDFKDNKFRYHYTDFIYLDNYNQPISLDTGSMVSKKKLILKIEENIKASIDNIKQYLIQSNKVNSDW